MTKQMNNEHIRVAAYFLWEKAGRPNGMDNDFWYQAQTQLYGSNLNHQNCQKSLSKSSSTKLASKKVSLKPALKQTMKQPSLKKAVSSKPAILAKPFYGNKK